MRHSVYNHLILATVIFSCVMISGVLLSTHFAVMQGITATEQETAPEVAEKVLQILKMEEKSHGIFTRDWGVWDDTYQFIQDGNDEYIRSNLMDDTFSSAMINIALFVDKNGKIVYKKGFDYINNSQMDIPDNLYDQLASGGFLNRSNIEHPVNGILPLDAGPMLVSIQGIYRSDKSGPQEGFLIFGRYLSTARIREISDNSVFPFEIIGPYAMKEQYVPGSSLPFAEMNDSGKAIITYSVIPDIYQNPAYIVKTEIPFRSPYTPSLIVFLIGTTSIICLLFIGLVILYYRRYFLKQLQGLTDILEGSQGSLESDSFLTGAPAELSSLAHAVDETTTKLRYHQDELARTQEELALAEERIRILFENAHDAICVIENTGIVDCNQVFSGIFQKDRGWLIGQDVHQLPALIDSRFSESFRGFINRVIDNPSEDGSRFEWSFPVLPVSDKNVVIFDIIVREVKYHESRLLFIIARDITEQKEIQKDQERLLLQLEENLVHMGTLNDQIRNPLTIISTLVDEGPDPERDRILHEVSRIDHLIRSLDEGFVSSEKVWKFLHKKRDYNFEKMES